MALNRFGKDMSIIAALDDEPNDVGGLSAADLKAKFDEGGEALKQYLNDVLLPLLEHLGVESITRSGNGVAYLRLNDDNVLEVSTDGINFEATGSSGHLILDANNNILPQRSRMKFANGTVTDDGTNTIITGMKGDTGEKGEKGDTGEVGPVGPIGPVGPSIVPSIDPETGVMSFTIVDTAIAPPSVSVRGPQGPQGIQGPVGPQGEIGPEGPQGAAGPAGADGKSAYQAATDGGYTGTETALNAALAAVPSHISDPNIHITAAERAAWNSKEAGGAAAAVQTNLTNHESNTVKHITADERTAWNGKAAKATIVTATLAANGWADGAYILTVDDVTATSNQEILPAVNITAEQLEALQGANIQDGGQTAGNVTLKAYGDVPTIDIPIRIIKRGD